MGSNSNIEWTEATWNPVSGCTRVSAGCDHCYAVQQSHRLGQMGQAEKYGGLTVLNGKGDRHFNGTVRTHEAALSIPLKRNKPTVWFVNSMSDLFHKDVPFEFIDKIFAVMALTPQHTFQVLTKRPERMAAYLGDDEVGLRVGRAACNIGNAVGRFGSIIPEAMPKMHRSAVKAWPLPNVWLGTSVENQATADERIPHLLKCPAAIRFLSCEPLLSAVDLSRWLQARWQCSGCREFFGGDHEQACPACHRVGYWTGSIPRLHQTIVGGESGPGARPMHPDWARSLRDQCQAAGVAYFFKQWGEYVECHHADPAMVDVANDDSLKIDDARLSVVAMKRVGKKAAGRDLDGRTWDELPGRKVVC